MSDPFPILLTDTTRWAGSSRLALALANSGCTVYCVCPGHHPVLKVRALRGAFSYSALRPLESLAAAIKSASPVMVIPCDDRAVYHLHELHARAGRQGRAARSIAEVIEKSLGPPESYPIVSSRYELLQAASKEGIHVPATERIRTVDDLARWQGGKTNSCVLKVDGTGGGYGVRIAHDPEEARTHFQDLTRLLRMLRVFKRLIVNRDPFWLRPWWSHARPAVIVQEFIHGRPANCAVVCHKGRILAGIAVEVVCAIGTTEPASVVRVVDHPEMMSAAEKIARRLHLSGFFGLDFILEADTGAARLIEMNPRITPQCHLRLGRCRDMVGALMAQLSEKAVLETPPVTASDMIAYFPQAWWGRNEFFQTSFHDLPNDEPDLVRELLNPWLDRTLLFRFFNYLHRQPAQSSQYSFTEAVTPATIPGRDLNSVGR